jgi:hypothetical protein
VNYCIGISGTRTQAEIEQQMRSHAIIPSASAIPPPTHGVRMMGVRLPAGSERKTELRRVEVGMRTN